MALLGVVAALVVDGGTSAIAQTTTAPKPLPPKASILIDADTGAVLDEINSREPLPPASLTKILTALTAVAALEPHTTVPVSARAAGMPAHNLNMKPGQVWPLEDMLAALLMSSANDAGMALAEHVSDTAEAFGEALDKTATRLGLADHPTLRDPSGLDDEFSVAGGNRISARDLAIAARAALAEPRVASIMAMPVYTFTGPDGVGHRLGNHNKLLKVYAGAVGMKTGYTRRSLHSLAAAATRNGRTMIAIILGAPGDTYGPATALLDRGFATPVAAQQAYAHLPQSSGARREIGSTAAPTRSPAPRESPSPASVDDEPVVIESPRSESLVEAAGFGGKVLLGLLAVVAILRVRPRERRPSVAEGNRRYIATQRRPPPSAPRSVASHSHATTAPSPSRPVAAARSRPRPTRPIRRRADTEPEPAIDARLATRFEILVRTGQVVP